jgi:Protein of unknown function (DUF2946)
MSKKMDGLMRRRLRTFLPIVLIALMMQILAPIAACWAAGIAASDPLHQAVICHDDGASSSGPTDQTGQSGAHAGCCSLCYVVHTGAPLDAPQATVATPYRHPKRVAWLERTPDLFRSPTGSHAQARAPPPNS